MFTNRGEFHTVKNLPVLWTSSANFWTFQYELLAHTMLTGGSLAPGTPPEDLLDQQISFVPGVVLGTTVLVNFKV